VSQWFEIDDHRRQQLQGVEQLARAEEEARANNWIF
jgi:hypothetical protein